MTPVEAAAIIRDKVKEDPDLRRATAGLVKRAGVQDIYEWCEQHPDYANALAEQLLDIDGQVRNMTSRLEHGDLS